MTDLSPKQFEDLREQLNAAMQAAATTQPAASAGHFLSIFVLSIRL